MSTEQILDDLSGYQEPPFEDPQGQVRVRECNYDRVTGAPVRGSIWAVEVFRTREIAVFHSVHWANAFASFLAAHLPQGWPADTALDHAFKCFCELQGMRFVIAGVLHAQAGVYTKHAANPMFNTREQQHYAALAKALQIEARSLSQNR